MTSFESTAVLLLRPDGELELANAAACATLGCRDERGLSALWPTIREQIAPRLAAARRDEASGGPEPLEVDARLTGPDPQERRLRGQCYSLAATGGWLLLFTDPQAMDDLEADHRLAMR